jgi:hypothetical protein
MTMTASNETGLAVRAEGEEWSVARIIEQTTKIQQCMTSVMKNGEHYGVIPGTQGKPTLLKPGAEKLLLMFRLKPSYIIVDKTDTDVKIAFTIRCLLTHITTGNEIAEGLGSCNSREAKYARAAPKKCPECGKEAIIKGKEEYGGGWLCFKKKQGCGAKWPDGAEEIEGQVATVADPSDLHNTILKMACKRALVAAVLNGTAASDFFTQDLEDLGNAAAEYQPPPEREHSTQREVSPKDTQEAEYEAARRADEMEADDRISRPKAQTPVKTATTPVSPTGTSVASARAPSSPASADDGFVTVQDARTGAKTQQPRVGADQLAEIEALGVRGGWSRADLIEIIKKRCKVEMAMDMGRGQAVAIIAHLTKKLDAAKHTMDGVSEYAEPDRREVVAADPDPAQKVGSEPEEPGVAVVGRGPGFSGGGSRIGRAGTPPPRNGRWAASSPAAKTPGTRC